jgi:hypothetical protein
MLRQFFDLAKRAASATVFGLFVLAICSGMALIAAAACG